MISTMSSAVVAWAPSRRGRSGPGLGAAASGVPQLSQNLLSPWTFAPQLEQTVPNSAPHSRQNRAPSRFSAWHRGHSMRHAPFWLVHRIEEGAKRSAGGTTRQGVRDAAWNAGERKGLAAAASPLTLRRSWLRGAAITEIDSIPLRGGRCLIAEPVSSGSAAVL